MIKHTLKTFLFLYLFVKYKKSLKKGQSEKAALKLADFITKERGVFLKMCQYLGTNKKHHVIIKNLSFQKIELLSTSEIELVLKHSKVTLPQETIVGECLASASIGQVNAIEIDGAKVIKVKFPGLDKQIKHQQTLLKILPKKVIKRKTKIDLDDYSHMIGSLLSKECDFAFELKMQEEVSSIFPGNNHFKVPKVYAQFSCKEFIISERLEPVQSQVVAQNAKAYCENLAFTYLYLFESGYAQGDSNHGNFLFLSDNKIGVIDFGQFYRFSQEFIGALVSLIYKLRGQEQFDDFDYYKAMGFKPEVLELIRPHLRMLSLILFEPFLVNKSFNLLTWDYVTKINSILGQKKWLFRSAGGEEFFMIIKSFVGLKNLIIKQESLVNWYQVFDEVFYGTNWRSFEPEKSFGVPTNQAQWIKILVKENNKTKSEHKFSLGEVFQIENHLPSSLTDELILKGIDLRAICTEALKSGSSPCELIDFEIEGKKYFISMI